MASAAVAVLAGCGHPTSTIPSVLSGGSSEGFPHSTPTAPPTDALGGGAQPRAGSSSSARSSSSSRSSAVPASAVGTSIPFPVAVGDTWVYRTQIDAAGGSGTTTNQIVASGPTPAGYRVAMASTSEVAGTTASTEPVFYFHANGTIGYPVTQLGGISVEGSVPWPDAAGLLYGGAYRSVLRVGVATGGAVRYENANVTVQGAGTSSVTVPAGTYSALLVKMTFSLKLGNLPTTAVISNWLAASIGPVKTVEVLTVGGTTEFDTTSELVSFGQVFRKSDSS